MELTKICRVCLMPEGGVYLLDWHQQIESSEYVLSYKECFCLCTQINLSLSDTEDDEIQFLCLFCAQSLKEAYEFIEKAKKADKELRSREIDKDFEWVAVTANGVETHRKNYLVEEMKPTNEWDIQSRKEEDINKSNHIDQEDTNSANSNEENLLIELQKCAPKVKRKRNEHILNVISKSDGEEFMDDIDLLSGEDSDHDSFSDKKSRKVRKQTGGSNVAARKYDNMDEMVPCGLCPKVMKRRSLRQHQHRHKPKRFLCHACPKAFIDAQSLKNHKVIHEENRERVPCAQCGETFASNRIYKIHLLTHDINRKPQFQCTHCGKSFLYKQTFLTHQQHHAGTKIKCNSSAGD